MKWKESRNNRSSSNDDDDGEQTESHKGKVRLLQPSSERHSKAQSTQWNDTTIKRLHNEAKWASTLWWKGLIWQRPCSDFYLLFFLMSIFIAHPLWMCVCVCVYVCTSFSMRKSKRARKRFAFFLFTTHQNHRPWLSDFLLYFLDTYKRRLSFYSESKSVRLSCI